MSTNNNTNSFTVELDAFDGPIDLLLHLVKRQELEISKLSLSAICHQYLSYVEQMRQLDLDMASEYLVIAATLVSIKSSLMLNREVELVADEDGDMFDPHEQLLLRLREAEIYKEAANRFSDISQFNLDVFAPKSTLSKFSSVDMGLANHESHLLVKALHKALDRLADRKAYQIVLESVSIVERMNFLMESLTSRGRIKFVDLLAEAGSKSMVIGTFLAVLELSKRQIICISGETVDEVSVALVDVSSTADLSSEYDISPEAIEANSQSESLSEARQFKTAV